MLLRVKSMIPHSSKALKMSTERLPVSRWRADMPWEVSMATTSQTRVPSLASTSGKITCKRTLKIFTCKTSLSWLKDLLWIELYLVNTLDKSWQRSTSPSFLPSGKMKPHTIKECYSNCAAVSTPLSTTMKNFGHYWLRTSRQSSASIISSFSRLSTSHSQL